MHSRDGETTPLSDLLTVSISVDTAVRIFASTGSGSGPSFGTVRCVQAISTPSIACRATASVRLSAGFIERNPYLNIYTAFLGRLLSQQENRYGRPLCYGICKIIIGGNSRARLLGTGLQSPRKSFCHQLRIFLAQSSGLVCRPCSNLRLFLTGVGPVPNGNPRSQFSGSSSEFRSTLSSSYGVEGAFVSGICPRSVSFGWVGDRPWQLSMLRAPRYGGD